MIFTAKQLVYALLSFHTQPLKFQRWSSSYTDDIYDPSFELIKQGVNGLSPLLSGLVMFPGAALAAILGRKGGKLVDQKGNGFVAYTALLGFFLGYGIMSIITGSSPFIIMIVLIFALKTVVIIESEILFSRHYLFRPVVRILYLSIN
ncbi:hypothetical protein [Peribacillus simplex]|uniref:hypothetical protein n=1 Tax=Peribacillus simplex TaxID=1478 RepID=UPI003670E2E4